MRLKQDHLSILLFIKINFCSKNINNEVDFKLTELPLNINLRQFTSQKTNLAKAYLNKKFRPFAMEVATAMDEDEKINDNGIENFTNDGFQNNHTLYNINDGVILQFMKSQRINK